MMGQARDIATAAAGSAPIELASACFTITASPRREILAITTTPRHPREQELIGVRAGGASRAALASLMGDIRGSALFQLLDDFAGASLVAPWIWSQWKADWPVDIDASAATANAGRAGQMADVCTGFAKGSSSLTEAGTANHAIQSRTEVGPLEHPDDPEGWHAMPPQSGEQARRARRIDLTLDGDRLRVDAGFQDSGSNPGGGRTAVHEYHVQATVDAATMRVVSLAAQPLILPYAECPGAAANVARMIGRELASLREEVPATLAGPLGCTHLNDILRSFADVPALARHLPRTAELNRISEEPSHD